ncbi:DUF4294 domain-containing protein [Neolewinella lacunae]|uniref:DUF4294 domain-containing protein n=1 Tax=Neolewinella lacunae TaxID=1517758 RepID=A0A923T6C1_9BACT|nr:DUF4294 domain-containing protein [Neolewinella lacunae]MBC6993265.1 DUF4294 domain-containing protein [Neolewinella lacunae]MDN3635688.1 DUF4294 domain-containing protein [Neolewinella lacunae]
MRISLPLLLVLFLGTCVSAQQAVPQNKNGYTKIDGKYYPYVVDACGDTLIIAQLGDVSISSPEVFETEEDYKQYRRYRIYAQRAYPYAVDAIRIFRETQYMTQNMSNSERKKYNKRLQKELEEKFEEPLKKMSKTQGKVLISMIERELDVPIYDLIKELRGGLTARYWATLAGFYGHRLKHKYTVGDDWILDTVLDDFDISYELPEMRADTTGVKR